MRRNSNASSTRTAPRPDRLDGLIAYHDLPSTSTLLGDMLKSHTL